jgi:hypothetical protein
VKRAMSTLDGKDWDAAEFNARDPAWKNAQRRYLTCLACGGRAFFRAASTARRPAFGARHDTNCAFAIGVSWSAFRYLQ